MKKGICFYFGFDSNPEQRAKAIKDAGFDCVITCADPNMDVQNGNIKTQVKLFKKYGLELSSLHMTYSNPTLPMFWTQSKEGKKIEKRLKKDVKIAHKYGFKEVVVHLVGTPNQIGLKRLKRVLKLCHRLNVPLAIENVEDYNVFRYTFANIKDDYLKFCWDCGHSNVYFKDIDYPKIYGEKMICLHLHDNSGLKDDHTLNKYGNIDWDEVAKKIAKYNKDIYLDYEMLMHYKTDDDTLESVLEETFLQAKELEEKILAITNDATSDVDSTNVKN